MLTTTRMITTMIRIIMATVTAMRSVTMTAIMAPIAILIIPLCYFVKCPSCQITARVLINTCSSPMPNF